MSTTNNSTTSTDTALPTTSSAAASVTRSSSQSESSRSIANNSSTLVSSTSDSTTSSTTLPSTSSTPTTSTTPSSTTAPTTSTTPTTSSSIIQSSSAPTSTTAATTTSTTAAPPGGSTTTVLSIKTQSAATSTTSTSSSSTASSTAGLQSSGKSTSSHGLGTGGTIAVAVVVPIVAVALLVLAGLFLWRKRKARKDAEELRRKEVEEYGYNPNNDPTLPAVGSAGGRDGPFEMREEGSSGYRGWGTTAVASSGRKASTTLSGGQSAAGVGMAYSGGTSPTYGALSDTRSDNPLVDGRPGDAEVLGAMGPAASTNRGGDINRGPSNASSSYSAANRSDGSGEIGVPGGAYYNNQYDTGNPYDQQYGSSPQGRAEMPAQPVIRDVQARRNTRIENPSHFPQQSAGISQNF